MKAIIESIGKVGSRVVVGGHEVVFDQPAPDGSRPEKASAVVTTRLALK